MAQIGQPKLRLIHDLGFAGKGAYYCWSTLKPGPKEPMTKLAQATISLGAQTSGDDDRTHKHVLELRKLFAIYCAGPYSKEILEFALILRIGGKFQEFDFEGCERVRRNRKDKYITVDLVFPSSRWKGVSDRSLREYLSGIVETGLLCCLHRLKKDKVKVQSAALMTDFAEVKRRFLHQT